MMTQQDTTTGRLPAIAVACGVAGLLASFVMYWLVLPGIVLGLAAVGLGWRARAGGRREIGSVAIALGVVGVLLVPAFLQTATGAEDWGRDCALHPEHDPNC